MSYILDRLTFFRHAKQDFADGHGVTTTQSRAWEDGYRKRWQHDKVVRSWSADFDGGQCWPAAFELAAVGPQDSSIAVDLGLHQSVKWRPLPG